MTVIVVGISHRSAPFDVLDQVALGDYRVDDFLDDVMTSPHVAEAMAVSTCNRLEVYADVDRFHGAVEDIGSVLAKTSGIGFGDLVGHVYVHYDERAIHHLFSVAAGLDSMIVGEQQILGQVRTALRTAQETGAAGRVLNALGQTALRVGKRVHSETGIDRHGASVVSVGLDMVQNHLGSLDGKRVVVVGAGAMAALTVSNLANYELGYLSVVNRTGSKADRLIRDHAGANPAQSLPLAQLAAAVATADVVIACTGATGVLVDADTVSQRQANRPLVLLDLALPHDIDPQLSVQTGVTLIDLSAMSQRQSNHGSIEQAAADIVELETQRFLARQAAASVEPLVVGLRARADGILEQEVARLRLRLPQLTSEAAAEVEHAMRRAMGTLLHTPTVRMKQLAADPEGTRFTAAVKALFDLDPATVQAISTAPEPAEYAGSFNARSTATPSESGAVGIGRE